MGLNITTISTYQSGITQAKAYRLLGKLTTAVLEAHDLSMLQWYVVGLAYDAGEDGVQIGQLPQMLGTSLPFVTTTINQLVLKGIILKTHLARDNRVRIVRLEPSYRSTVEEIETAMRNMLRRELYGKHDITREELTQYISVLYKLSS